MNHRAFKLESGVDYEKKYSYCELSLLTWADAEFKFVWYDKYK
ncbi:hypothetical protein FACS1894122_05590 [Alphaproteobacteria bacterium]|nr:hypothetical protein FACS1894122_05590 [Alphaproteobacteria bacterium]